MIIFPESFLQFFLEFFSQFFSWNQSCQQLKSTKPQHFHEFFTQKKKWTIFSGNQSWIFGQKMKISNSVIKYFFPFSVLNYLSHYCCDFMTFKLSEENIGLLDASKMATATLQILLKLTNMILGIQPPNWTATCAHQILKSFTISQCY